MKLFNFFNLKNINFLIQFLIIYIIILKNIIIIILLIFI
jgi:hypothetical protein